MCEFFMWLMLLSAGATGGPVRALTIDGKSLQGTWAGVDASGRMVLESGGIRTPLAASELMLLRWPESPAASQPAATQPAGEVTLYLNDGSRLAARLTGGSARQIEVQAGLVPSLRLPLERLSAMKFGADQPAGEDALKKALAERDPSQDTLLALRDGRVTVLRGVVDSLGPQGGDFKWKGRSVPIRPGSVYAIVFAAGGQQPEPAPLVCVLRDGSAWAGRISGGSEATLQLALSAGAEVTLRIEDVREIRFRSDRVIFLSELKVSDYRFEPFAVTRWPYRFDRSVANRPLRIGDENFDRGIGMHSQSRLTFEPPAGFKQLAATIGIDNAARPRGNAVFRVLADDREVFNSGAVTGRDAPRPILVPVSGAKRLQLAVDFGEDLDVGDQADWGNARLIK